MEEIILSHTEKVTACTRRDLLAWGNVGFYEALARQWKSPPAYRPLPSKQTETALEDDKKAPSVSAKNVLAARMRFFIFQDESFSRGTRDRLDFGKNKIIFPLLCKILVKNNENSV